MDLVKAMSRLGWIFFALVFVAMGVLFISLIGMPEGEYALEELPPLVLVSGVALGACFIATMVCLVGAPVVSGLTNRAIRAKGLPAGAVILETRDTGTRINDSPIVRFTLEVHTPDGQVFQAETERLIPLLSLPQIQPGTTVPVKYNPANRKVALDM